MTNREALRSFLVERRSRLERDSVGLPQRHHRCRGVSQEEVAELSGVSLTWYELFESGRGNRRVSLAFLDRLSAALHLDDCGRLELFRLAAPQSEASALVKKSVEDGAISASRNLRKLSERLLAAGDIHEIAGVAAEMLHRWIKPDSSTIATLNVHGSVTGFGVGPRGDFVSSQTVRLHWDTLYDLPLDRVGVIPGGRIEEMLRSAQHYDVLAVSENVVPLRRLYLTPEVYRDAWYPLRAASSLSLPLVIGGQVQGLIGACWQQPREYSALEIESARAVCGLVQLVTARKEMRESLHTYCQCVTTVAERR